jgi:hypothetical protein
MKGKNFMLEDRTWVKNLINARDDDEIIIPLYVQIYGKKYPLLKLDEIKKRFSPSAFKVGYGTADAWFMKNSFPVNRISEFDLVDTFSEYDSKNERNIRYTVFESGDVDVREDDKLDGEIHMYFDLLFNNVKERVDAYFKSLIESENVPIVPREHVEDGLPRHIPIAEESDDNIPYPSIDDEDDDYITSDDSLEELRKEVAEYSQDDEDTIPGLIVETNDDYLSEEDEYPRVTEGGVIGKETVDFINGEGKYSDDNEDYSTDFDVY